MNRTRYITALLLTLGHAPLAEANTSPEVRLLLHGHQTIGEAGWRLQGRFVLPDVLIAANEPLTTAAFAGIGWVSQSGRLSTHLNVLGLTSGTSVDVTASPWFGYTTNHVRLWGEAYVGLNNPGMGYWFTAMTNTPFVQGGIQGENGRLGPILTVPLGALLLEPVFLYDWRSEHTHVARLYVHVVL